MTKWSSGQVQSPDTGTLDPSIPRSLPLGIAMGDPAGIGPEVILKALTGADYGPDGNMTGLSVNPDRVPGPPSSHNVRRRLSVVFPNPKQFRIIGNREVFEQEQKRLGTGVDLSLVDDSVKLTGTWKMGRVQKKCGLAALEALEAGVAMLKERRVSALVTAPVSKEALRLAGFSWPGQTEFLADRLSARRHAMLAWTPSFKVVFVTIHLPLARVARHITSQAVYEKIVLLDEFLRIETGAPRSGVHGSESSVSTPRICVMAFNPHGYELTLGEEAKIAAAIARARRAGISAFGPVPADAAVAGLSSTRPLDHSTTRPLPPFDGFVAMYHDQAMIPAKLLGRDAGVNVTLGLGRIRTSPLHGTAFDIAGRRIADAGSMASALALARRLAQQKTDKAARGRLVR